MVSHDFMATFYSCHFPRNLILKFLAFLAKKGQNLKNKFQENFKYKKWLLDHDLSYST